MATPQKAATELNVGQRLSIEALSGKALGLGTHLWNGIILLDKGTRIRQECCRFEPAAPSPVPPFSITLNAHVRAFRRESNWLFNEGLALSPGKATIHELATSFWNHGIYVAGRFEEARGGMFWLLMSELDLPDEHAPQLHVAR